MPLGIEKVTADWTLPPLIRLTRFGETETGSPRFTVNATLPEKLFTLLTVTHEVRDESEVDATGAFTIPSFVGQQQARL